MQPSTAQNSEFSLRAQLAIADQRPEVNRAMTTMLDAHQTYLDSKPEPSGPPHAGLCRRSGALDLVP